MKNKRQKVESGATKIGVTKSKVEQLLAKSTPNKNGSKIASSLIIMIYERNSDKWENNNHQTLKNFGH